MKEYKISGYDMLTIQGALVNAEVATRTITNSGEKVRVQIDIIKDVILNKVPASIEERVEAVEIDTTELKDSIIRVESMIKELREMGDGEDA